MLLHSEKNHYAYHFYRNDLMFKFTVEKAYRIDLIDSNFRIKKQ